MCQISNQHSMTLQYRGVPLLHLQRTSALFNKGFLATLSTGRAFVGSDQLHLSTQESAVSQTALLPLGSAWLKVFLEWKKVTFIPIVSLSRSILRYMYGKTDESEFSEDIQLCFNFTKFLLPPSSLIVFP